MTESVVSFTKPTGQVTPYWLLQQLASSLRTSALA
jgi:hypothetical protein